MGDYLRVTRECTLDSMHPILVAAIRAHIEKYELGDVDASALMCCETISTRHKKSWFGGKAKVFLTGMLLSPEWLIWASGKENEVLGVHSARLRDVRVQDYEKSEMYQLVQDMGLNISGPRTDAVDTGSIFIGLGPEPAAQKFRARLKEAMAKA